MIDLLQEVDGLPPGRYAHMGEETETRLVCAGLARVASGRAPSLNPLQVSGYGAGAILRPDGASRIQFTVGNFVSVQVTGLARSTPGLLTMIKIDVAGGTLKIFDSLTAEGTVAYPELTIPPPGTLNMARGGLMGIKLETGAYVVLSDAAARIRLLFD